MISKNYLNILVVQIFLLLFCSVSFSISNKICFVLKWRSIIIISHVCIINCVISFKISITSRSIGIIITIFNQIVDWHCNINKICFINKNTSNFCRTFFKRCTIFTCFLCSCSKWLFYLNRIIVCCSNSSFNRNISCN